MNDQTTNVTGVPPQGEAGAVDQGAIDALAARLDQAEARAEAAEKAAADAQGKTPVYAVYDKTFERYLGDVHETKDKATKAAKAAKVESYRVDEVYR